jgi:DNA-binding HxlR family transcriptional regulator
MATSEGIGCIKAATAILGDKWTPLLLRHFINEDEVRFCQLQDLADGINPRTLSARLSYLEETGIITKITHETTAHCTYQLTNKGGDLLPILKSMQAWGEKYGH